MENPSHTIDLHPVAMGILAGSSSDERQALVSWARQMLQIRSSSLSTLRKAKQAYACTLRAGIIARLMRRLGRDLETAGIRTARLWRRER